MSGDVGDGDGQPSLLEALQRMMLGDDDHEEKADDTAVEQTEYHTDEHTQYRGRESGHFQGLGIDHGKEGTCRKVDHPADRQWVLIAPGCQASQRSDHVAIGKARPVDEIQAQAHAGGGYDSNQQDSFYFHFESRGSTMRLPRLLAILQEHGIMNPTPPDRTAGVQLLLSRMY